jgi:hypothetical protein
MSGSEHKNVEDKENRRYAKLEDRKVRTDIDLGIKNMEDKENKRYDSLEDRKVRICMNLGTKMWRIKRTEGMIVWKIRN